MIAPPNPLIELAERVQALTCACRETDRDILFATFPKERTAIFDGVKYISTMTGRDGEPWFNPLADRTDCPYYTEDLNDAMSISTRWRSIRFEKTGDTFGCFVDAIDTNAATPTLALASAQLRARAASENSHGR